MYTLYESEDVTQMIKTQSFNNKMKKIRGREC